LGAATTEAEMREMKAEHGKEVTALNRAHDESLAALTRKQDAELSTLQVRVRQTMDTKDSTILQLRAELAASQHSLRATEEALRTI
jgi:hypothetical protein